MVSSKRVLLGCVTTGLSLHAQRSVDEQWQLVAGAYPSLRDQPYTPLRNYAKRDLERGMQVHPLPEAVIISYSAEKSISWKSIAFHTEHPEQPPINPQRNLLSHLSRVLYLPSPDLRQEKRVTDKWHFKYLCFILVKPKSGL